MVIITGTTEANSNSSLRVASEPPKHKKHGLPYKGSIGIIMVYKGSVGIIMVHKGSIGMIMVYKGSMVCFFGVLKQVVFRWGTLISMMIMIMILLKL